MTAGNIITVVILTLAAVALFVAAVLVSLRFLLKGMDKYGITPGGEKKEKRAQPAAAIEKTKEKKEREEQTQQQPAQPETHGAPEPRFFVGQSFRDSLMHKLWFVDAVSISMPQTPDKFLYSCTYSCHSEDGLYAQFVETSDADGYWPENYTLVPLMTHPSAVSTPTQQQESGERAESSQPFGTRTYQRAQSRQADDHGSPVPLDTKTIQKAISKRSERPVIFGTSGCGKSYTPSKEQVMSARKHMEEAAAAEADTEGGNDDGFAPFDVKDIKIEPFDTTHYETCYPGDKPMVFGVSGAGKTYLLDSFLMSAKKRVAKDDDDDPVPPYMDMENFPDEFSDDLPDLPHKPITPSDDPFDRPGPVDWDKVDRGELDIGENPADEDDDQEDDIPGQPIPEEDIAPTTTDSAGSNHRNARSIIQKWREENPEGTRMQCGRDTMLSPITISQWWDEARPLQSYSKDELGDICEKVRGWQLMRKQDGTVTMCSAELKLPQEIVAKFWDYDLGQSQRPLKGASTLASIRELISTPDPVQDDGESEAPKHPSKRNQGKSTYSREAYFQRKKRQEEIFRCYGKDNSFPEGRATPEQTIRAWQVNHPDGNKTQCRSDLGYSKETMDKFWKRRRTKKQDTPTITTVAEPAISEPEAEAPVTPKILTTNAAAVAVPPSAKQPEPPAVTAQEDHSHDASPRSPIPTLLAQDMDVITGKSLKLPTNPLIDSVVADALAAMYGTPFYPKTDTAILDFASVSQWRRAHPDKTKSQCSTALGLKRFTVDAWWKFAKP